MSLAEIPNTPTLQLLLLEEQFLVIAACTLFGIRQCYNFLLSNSIFASKGWIDCSDIREHKWLHLVRHFISVHSYSTTPCMVFSTTCKIVMTYPNLRCVLRYTHDHQLYHQRQLMTLDIQVKLLICWLKCVQRVLRLYAYVAQWCTSSLKVHTMTLYTKEHLSRTY